MDRPQASVDIEEGWTELKWSLDIFLPMLREGILHNEWDIDLSTMGMPRQKQVTTAFRSCAEFDDFVGKIGFVSQKDDGVFLGRGHGRVQIWMLEEGI